MRILRPTLLLAAALFVYAPEIRAQPVDDATRSAARSLAEEGIALYKKADYANALDRLSRADAVVHFPSVGIWVARSLVKLGRLVEASERYLALSRLELAADAKPAFKTAVADAATERVALLPRIPKLTVVIDGIPVAATTVTVDGAVLPLALLGVTKLTDPGTHHVEAKRGEASALTDVGLKEGGSERVVLTLVEPKHEVAAAGVVLPPMVPMSQPAAPKAADGAPPSEAPAKGKPSIRRALGWTAIGLGGASVLAGVITGGIVVKLRGDLDAEGCVNGGCDAKFGGDVARYNTLRTVSTATLIAGGVLLVPGIVLVATAPTTDGSVRGVRVETWIGGTVAGVRGVF